MRPSGLLQSLEVSQCRNIGVRERCDATRAGHRLNQDVLPFAVKIGRHQLIPVTLPPGAGKRGRKPSRDHVLSHDHNRNGLGRFLEDACDDIASAHDRVGGSLDQRRHQVGDLLVADLKTPWKNHEILAFDEAVDAQLVEEGDDRRRISCDRDQEAKTIGPARLLRARRKRPRRGCAAE
jgi:hypothetical protein